MLKGLFNFQNYSRRTLIIVGLCVLALVGFLYLHMAKTGNKELGGENETNVISEAPIENTDETQVMEGTNLDNETHQVSCHTEEGQIETFEEAVSDVFMDVNIGGEEKTMILKLKSWTGISLIMIIPLTLIFDDLSWCYIFPVYLSFLIGIFFYYAIRNKFIKSETNNF